MHIDVLTELLGQCLRYEIQTFSVVGAFHGTVCTVEPIFQDFAPPRVTTVVHSLLLVLPAEEEEM